MASPSAASRSPSLSGDLMRDALLLVRAADRAEVAPGARALGRRRGQEARARSRDRRSRAPRARHAAVRVVDRDLVIGEAARRGAVEQPSRRRPASSQPCSTARLYSTGCSIAPPPITVFQRRAVLAGLVIGDAQLRRPRLLLDEIDRAAQQEAAVDQHRIGHAARIAALRRVRPKLNSKYSGMPVAAVGQAPRPDAQVARDVGDLVAPDPIDRRRELLVVLGRDPRDDRVEHSRAPEARSASVTGSARRRCSARKNSAWTSWNSAPRVSGSSFCSGSGSSAGSSR